MFGLHFPFAVLPGRRPALPLPTRDITRIERRYAAMVLGFILCITTGCAVHYYDPTTGAEHIWGVGHLVMQASAPNEGVRALLRGTETIGFTLSNRDGPSITMGWEKWQRLEIIDENTAVRLERPKGDLINMRVGSSWPPSTAGPDSNHKEVQP